MEFGDALNSTSIPTNYFSSLILLVISSLVRIKILMSILFPVSKGWTVGVRGEEAGGASKFIKCSVQ